jgi:phosphatidylcholine synthase
VYLLHRFGLVASDHTWVLALALVASSYGFCCEWAKTADGYFTGFPSYWNVVFLYAYMIRVPSWVLAAIMGVLALAVFVPIKYVYPSHTRWWKGLTIGLTSLGLLAILFLIAAPDHPDPRLLYGSLAYPAYYVLLSLYLHRRP